MAGDSEQRLEEQGQPSGSEPFLIGVSGGTASGKVSGGARGERSGAAATWQRGGAGRPPRHVRCPGIGGTGAGRTGTGVGRVLSLAAPAPHAAAWGRTSRRREQGAEASPRAAAAGAPGTRGAGGAQALSPSRPGPGSPPPLRGEQGQDGAGIALQNPPVASASASPPPPLSLAVSPRAARPAADPQCALGAAQLFNNIYTYFNDIGRAWRGNALFWPTLG